MGGGGGGGGGGIFFFPQKGIELYIFFNCSDGGYINREVMLHILEQLKAPL